MTELIVMLAVPAIAFIIFLVMYMAIEQPDWTPGLARYEKWKKNRALADDRKNYRDITEFAVEKGFADPRPDGWYGFDVESQEAILIIGKERFFHSFYSYSSDEPTAEYIIDNCLKNLTASAETFIKRRKLKAELDRITDPNRVILGERSDWKED